MADPRAPLTVTPLSLSGPRRRILYLTHNGLTEPLGRRQVMPYLVGLAARGWRFTVVSFEKTDTASPDALETVAELTRAAGIAWAPLRYRRHPQIVATALNVLEGVLQASRYRNRGIDLVHARSVVPALMARFLAWQLQAPWILDLRGLLAEEYVDAGHWPRGGLRYRLTSAAERALLRSAHGVVVLTRRLEGELGALGVTRTCPRVVIPCCVDVGVFGPSEQARREVRRELGWGDEPVLVYSGSLGSWYRLGEMLSFHEVARAEVPGLRFLVLTQQVALVEEAARRRTLDCQITARSVDADAVPRYLAACDVGICFLGEHRSKRASSPTKYGEYLATGLPVVTNDWIGDAKRFDDEPVWILVDAFARESYRRAARRVAHLLGDPATTRRAARALAASELATSIAVDRYDMLYRQVLDRGR